MLMLLEDEHAILISSYYLV